MKRLIASGLAILLVVGGIGIASSQNDGERPAGRYPGGALLDLYFIGKRLSQLEPCGCQTKQRGGIQYEASLYNQNAGRPTIKVDAGEFTRNRIDMAPLEALKTRFLLRAMQTMAFDAVNVARSETQLSMAFYESVEKDHPGTLAPLVSANVFLKDKPDQHAFKPEIIVEREIEGGQKIKVGITGISSLNWSLREDNQTLETESFLMKDPEESLAPVLERLRPQVDILVVIFAGGRDETMALAEKNQQIDYLIATANLPDPTQLSFRHGKTLILQTPNSLGKEVGMAQVKASEAYPGRWDVQGLPQSLYVSLDLPQIEPVLALINEFKKKTETLEVALPNPFDMKEVYSGSRTCAVCHREIHEDWSQTGHSHAMQTLVNVGQQFNPECVQCHTTGFRRDNGFYSVTDRRSLEYVNVQCEVCHGPAREHVMMEQQIMAGADRWKTPEEFEKLKADAKKVVPPAKVAESVCVQCHQGENDPHFVFNDEIHKVDHSRLKNAGAAVAPAAH